MASVTALLRGFSISSDEGSVGFCGVYLVRTSELTLVFDTGHAGRRRALLRSLDAHGLTPDDVDTVVLSHAHWDHVQNADLFPMATLLVHPAELDAPDPTAPPWTPAVLDGLKQEPARSGQWLAPGVEVVALPGHTAGSIGLAVDTAAGAALLTGDAVSSADALRSGRAI